MSPDVNQPRAMTRKLEDRTAASRRAGKARRSSVVPSRVRSPGHLRLVMLSCTMALLVARPSEGLAFAAVSDAAAVEVAIQRGVDALLGRVNKHDVITYRIGKLGSGTMVVTGRVVKDRGGLIDFETLDGRKLTIRRGRLVDWAKAGHIHPVMPEYARGGPSALAAFALLAAEVKTTEPRMAALLEALTSDDGEKAGTYAHSLRAGVWSMLLDRPISKENKRKYRRLLRQDVDWLKRAMAPYGMYTYASAGGADNSNTQFANLGLWAGSIANIEIARRYWQRTEEHWIGTQMPGGGWGYHPTSLRASSSMTVAGCNSLYIALEGLYANADKPYVLFKGARPNKKARKRMERLYRALTDGDAFLRHNPPDGTANRGYELFGLERLGLASGRSHIGGVDWFRDRAPWVALRTWDMDPIADAFALIFLVHGQAPVLMQKLEHDDDANEWNYYHRDLHVLMRYLSRTFERLHRWQRIPLISSLQSLEDAPILYISGRRKLTLPEDTLQRIRAYVDRGGTVFLHADGASEQFVGSATRIFEKMFSDRDLRFKGLVASHPLFRCHFGYGDSEWKRHIPLLAIADGPRLMVILCPVDIAGAWHQDRRRHEDLFAIMANLRVYCAPSYARLPRVLRSTDAPSGWAPHLGSLALRRVAHAGQWAAHGGVWHRQRDNVQRRTGIDLRVHEKKASLDGEKLSQYDVLHLTTRGMSRLDAPTQEALARYIEGGGLLLIDSADGQPRGNAAVRKLVDAIDVGDRHLLMADHTLAKGDMPGGQSLLRLETTSAGAGLNRRNTPPPILLRTVNGRVAVVACPFDLVAGLDGHQIWKRVGYTPVSTARIVDNILLLQWQQKSADRGR